MRLYYDERRPMREVAQHLGVSLNAVTYWMRKKGLPRRSAAEASIVTYDKKPLSFSVRLGRNEKEEQLDVIGAMLYWAEGYKSDKASGIDFANSDPVMIDMFMRFLRSRYVLDEHRFRVLLYCYSDQDVDALVVFWSETCGIPKSQFSHPYVRRDVREGGA